MVTVEKTRGSRVYIRSLGQLFERGDRADVDEETATYLVEERGDFDRVDGDGWEIPDPAEITVDELREAIDGASDDVLDVYEQAERDGKNRSTALEAIQREREG